MSTEAVIDEVLELSGPFVDKRARNRHRDWLASKSTDWLLKRRATLLETSTRPAVQGRLVLTTDAHGL